MGAFQFAFLSQRDELSMDQKIFVSAQISKNWSFGHDQCASFVACLSAQEME